MKARAVQPVKEQRGVALILSLFVMVFLSLQALAFLAPVMTEDAIATNATNHIRAFYAAEAGLEAGLVGLRTLLAASAAPTDAQLTAIAPPTLSDSNYTFNTFTVQRIRPTPYFTIIANGAYAGLIAQTTDYEITAEARGPRGSRARLSQIVQYMEIPLFQFGAFYGEGVDFENYAGPTFTFTGRVHANSDIYLADSDSNGMFFDSYVTAAGTFYRRRKDEACCDRRGNPDVKDGGGNYQTLDFDPEVKNVSVDGTSWEAGDVDYWRTEALKRFGGKVQDSAHGTEEIIPPIPAAFYDPNNPDVSSHLMIEKAHPSDTAELKEVKMYYQADVRIETNDAGLLTVTDGNGGFVDLAALGCDADTIATPTFHDKREHKNMAVTQVDIAKLVACGAAPPNGILYVSRDGANPGVRLVNGAQLPSQGLTVVSENPVYIQGDYNTVNKVPAAVLADAITILSNNWGPNNSDDNGHKQTSTRPAKDTTVNAALAMGPHAEAGPGASNGAFNNLPRFLEDWRGETLTYNGSMVALWHSQQATGAFRCCGDSGNNYYMPPIRNWSYDTLFDTTLPPGTPMGVIVMKGVWSQA